MHEIYPRKRKSLIKVQLRFPEMIEAVGLSKSIAVSTALILVVSILPTILLQWKGDSWRQAGN
jgi:hypothetical protein